MLSMKSLKKMKITRTHVLVVLLLILVCCVMLPSTPNKEYAHADGELVMYFAEWCGHCKKAKPDFEKLMSVTNRARLVDCSTPEAAKEHKVKSFPTYRFHFTHDNYEDYKGARDTQSMLDFINSH